MNPDRRGPARARQSDSEAHRTKRRRLGAIGAGIIAVATAIGFGEKLSQPVREPDDMEQGDAGDPAGGSPPPPNKLDRSDRQHQSASIPRPAPELSPEDLDRSDEHSERKDEAMRALAEYLPDGYYVSTTTAIDDQPIYDEYLKILGPDGQDHGSVYPGADGNYFYHPKEGLLSNFLLTDNEQLAPKLMAGPEAIGTLLTQVQVLEGYEQAWAQLDEDWPSENRMILHDGRYEMEPAYAEATQELTRMIRDAIRDYGAM